MSFVGGGGYKPSVWGQRFHDRREEEVFGAGAAGPGKALALDTLVPTLTGLKKLEDVHPGDTVFSVTGAQVKVLAETPVQLGRPCFKLNIFRQDIVADAEHEWIIINPSGPPLRTTAQLHESPFSFSVPFAEPADFGGAKPLIVDPYVLGVCMVAGQRKDRSKLTGWDLELYGLLQKVGYSLDEVGLRVSQIRERRDDINRLVAESGRRIPQQYLLGSFNQRMALVEGIMDGAGGWGPTFEACDLPFARDVVALAGSLGLAPKLRYGYRAIHKKGNSIGWYVALQSKKWRCTRRAHGRPYYRSQRLRYPITSVEPTESVPVKCIQVVGGVYCITEAYIPTHNSWVLLMDPIEQAWVEHLRCTQNDKLIPATFPADIQLAIKENPIRWGQSEGHALHLRRTLTRLQETITRAHRVFRLIDPDVDWNEKRQTFTWSSGFQYQFGHCKDRNDHTNYLGQQYTHLGFDELIEFLESQYHAICSRCRSGDPVLMLMLKKRAMSNPKLSDAKGEAVDVDDPEWVRRYFVDPAPQGGKILRRKITLESGEVTHTRRLFLPARLRDNPDKKFVRSYEIELRSRPKHIQECYLEGRWDSTIGSFFEHSYNPDIHRCRPFKIPQHWPIFRALDWGYVSHGCLGYYALDPNLDILYKFWDCVFQRKQVTVFVKTIMRPFEEANKLWNPFGGSLVYGPADTQIWEERGETALSKYQEFVQNGVDWCYADKRSREDNAQRVHERLTAHENFTRPPKLIFFENCSNSWKVLAGMQTDPTKPTEPKKGGMDHPYDETSYACAYIQGRTIDPPNYKGRVVEKDDEEPLEAPRGSFGYWQG